MGHALSKWIEGSLSAITEVEAERDRQAALLDTARRDAAGERTAISELERHIAKLTDERHKHASRLTALDHEIEVGTASLEGLEQDLDAMAKALENVADRPAPPAPTPTPAPSVASPRSTAPPPPKPTRTVVPEPSATQRAATASAEPSPEAIEKEEPQPDFELQLLEDDELPPRSGRSPWRIAAGVAVVLGVIGGGGYAAVQTEAGARVYANVRAQVSSVLGTSSASSDS